jgi:hypothetical protein
MSYHDIPRVSGLSPYEILYGRQRPLGGLPYEPSRVSEDAGEFMARMKELDKRVARHLNVIPQKRVEEVKREGVKANLPCRKQGMVSETTKSHIGSAKCVAGTPPWRPPSRTPPPPPAPHCAPPPLPPYPPGLFVFSLAGFLVQANTILPKETWPPGFGVSEGKWDRVEDECWIVRGGFQRI